MQNLSKKLLVFPNLSSVITDIFFGFLTSTLSHLAALLPLKLLVSLLNPQLTQYPDSKHQLKGTLLISFYLNLIFLGNISLFQRIFNTGILSRIKDKDYYRVKGHTYVLVRWYEDLFCLFCEYSVDSFPANTEEVTGIKSKNYRNFIVDIIQVNTKN